MVMKMLDGIERVSKEQLAAALHMAHMPVVSLNGTPREQLVAERLELLHRLRDAWAALLSVCPNGRDYADMGHLCRAQQTCRLRADLLKALMDDVELEIEWVSE